MNFLRFPFTSITRNYSDRLSFGVISRSIASNRRDQTTAAKTAVTIPEKPSEADLMRDDEDNLKMPEDFKRERKLQKSLKRKQHVSFVKQLFVGKFDTNMLLYPEVLDVEKLDTLQEMVTPVEKFFDQVDSTKIDREAKIGDDVMKTLKEFGLFGLQIPIEYGGLGLNATEYARMIEVTGTDASIATTLAAHQAIGLKGILMAGNEQQKAKYLPDLASGKHVAAFCLTEPGSGSDAASIQTHAKLNPDGKHWLLNGEKIWITNAGIADIFTVFAKTLTVNLQGETVDKITAFIVERNFGGITHGKPEDKLGIRGSNTASLHFDNTPVPVENVLGEVGEGFKLAVNILNSGRFSMGSLIAGCLRKLLALTVEHTITRKQFGKPLKDFGLIQEKIAKIACAVYAMESMAYLTAGVIDMHEQPDCAVEAAIVKVFSSENGWMSISECLQILGGMGYMKDYPFERYLRDSRICLIFEGTNEILRLFIALMGVQFAGRELTEIVKKLRNPFFHPGFVFRKMFEEWRQAFGKPKLNLDLPGNLHPSLRQNALDLEFCVLRFQYAVERVLARHGKMILEEQMTLRRLAEIVIDLYAMTATLSRSSRSYCIGLPNAEHELHLAIAFCWDASSRVRTNLDELIKGPILVNDENYTKIASTILKYKGYCTSHPLARNWR